jgi:hypothetical protein
MSLLLSLLLSAFLSSSGVRCVFDCSTGQIERDCLTFELPPCYCPKQSPSTKYFSLEITELAYPTPLIPGQQRILIVANGSGFGPFLMFQFLAPRLLSMRTTGWKLLFSTR